MALTTYNQFIERISNGYYLSQPFWREQQTATAAFGSNLSNITRLATVKQMPNPLPTGVTSYIITRVSATCSIGAMSFLFGRLINLGSLNIATPTFTDGSAMPTITELGDSHATNSPILIEVTTALNATPGSLTVTYVDQDGNSAETTTAQALGASSPIGNSGWIHLNTGDSGARDITTATRTGGTTPTGIIKFWGILPICLMSASPDTTTAMQENLLTGAFNPLRFGAGDEIGGFIIGGTSAKAMFGEMFVVGDN